ncbi:hypothetical protein [Chondromyces apiculatus]|uniref:Uncharacterized protein n=1 Tax=Chondromyces apiculatus DSM 436 TaxID=1192034 RepID=A0A017TG17_9BACT|nr:hypothetical protein [Chondromyces apiculatus]EYF08174.1 Hypothetical protein CAP_5934 [Chondromyces apiculatus DSM 436]
MTEYLVVFQPLCINGAGKKAILKHGYPPFVDGSCRREPDLQSDFPSISALCRRGKFAPRLKEGDRVAYLTVKRAWDDSSSRHWRLVAWLEVHEAFEDHRKAAAWYKKNDLVLPRNCMAPDNPPLPLDHTINTVPKNERSPVSGKLRGNARVVTPDGPLRRTSKHSIQRTAAGDALKVWDQFYKDRADEHGNFLACKLLWKELHEPPRVTEEDFREVFEHVPGLQNPGAYEKGEVTKLVERIRSACVGRPARRTLRSSTGRE